MYFDIFLLYFSVKATIQPASKGQPFSKSQSRQFTLSFEGMEGLEDFGLLQRVVMMSNISVLLQAGLAVIFAIIVVPMCALRLIHNQVLLGRLNRPRRPQHLIGR